MHQFGFKKRKQYIYHLFWLEYARQKKFSRLAEFGNCLPQIRESIEKDLDNSEWTKTKVLALVLHILNEYYLRVGSQYYTVTNQT